MQRLTGFIFVVFISCIACFASGVSHAQSYKALTIHGAYKPSILGTLPVTAPESWLWYQFSGGGRFTWFFGPGTDGGVVFNKIQGHPPYDDGAGGGIIAGDPGEMAGSFIFLNIPSVLFSTAPSGITIDAANTVHMDNLWLFRGPDSHYNLGAAVNPNPSVPLVPDITALGDLQSGWQVFPNRTYHLVYYTTWEGGQPMAIHLTGDAILVSAPTIDGFWPGAGAAGSFVFVFGNNFVAGKTQVSVNGITAALVQVMDPTLLIFVLPVGDTAGSLAVTTPDGSVAAGPFGASSSVLAINGIWPSQGPIGSFVFVFGSRFMPGQIQVSMNGVKAPLVQVMDSTLLIFAVPAGASSGPVTVTTSEGTANSSTVFQVM